MKFQKKLFINFTLLFTMLIALAGVLMIKAFMRNSYQSARTQCIDSFSVLVTSIQAELEDSTGSASESKSTGTSTQKTKEEQAMVKICRGFVTSLNLRRDHLVLLDGEQTVLYSSLEEVPTLDPDLFDFRSEISMNYEVTKVGHNHVIVMSRQIITNQGTYYLVFIYNIDNIYQMYHRYVLLLLVFLVTLNGLSAAAIYYFSMSITRPLNRLAETVQEVRKQHYDLELPQDTDIEEIQILSKEFQEMGQEIRHQIETLELQNQVKQRFIDGLSHEIRTPLTSIIGYSSLMLQSQKYDRKQVEPALETIHENGIRIQKLTENLVRLISLDQDSRAREVLSVRSILEELERSYRIRMEEEQVDFSITGVDMYVWSDRDLLTILLSNFLDNAIKAVRYTECKEIRLSFGGDRIQVIDGGKGIPKEDLNKIFEPFFMVDRSRKKTMGGFGLGLAICDRIMEILQITFSIDSQVGNGTCVTLCFAKEDIK